MDRFKIPPIVIGTWALGDSYWGEQSHSDSLKTIHAALREGFNYFDTAPVYGKGRSEQLLGQQTPKEVLIATKCFSKEVPQVKKSFETSLKRLNRERIDTFFIHWPSSKVDYAPVIEYLEKERESGRINRVGLSNFSLDMVKRSLNYGKIDIVQNAFNLFWIKNRQLFEYCNRNKILTQAYSPLAQGLLSGKFTRDTPYTPGDMRNHMVLFYRDNLNKLYPYIDEINKLAAQEEVKTSTLTLRWALSKVDSVVTGCRKRSQVEDLSKTKDAKISPKAFNELNNIAYEVDRVIGSYINIFNHQY